MHPSRQKVWRGRESSMLKSGLLASLLIALAIDPLAAQQPTEAQREAIRASCRSDFIANCSGVTPGGKEALECLLRNQSSLSESCKAAVNAITEKPAEPAAAPAEPAAPTPSRAESAPRQEPAPASATSEDVLKSVQKSCTLSDMMAHCSWIQPNNPEIVLCLKANAADLSPSCQATVQAAPTRPAAASAAEPERKVAPARKPEPERASAPPPAPVASAPKKPTPQQQSAIRAACRSDFISHCSGVTPGGAAALQCLQRNAAQLSSGCRGALAAISGGSVPAAAASEAAAPAAAAPAAEPIGPMPMLRPREALAILRICGADTRVFCAGIPMGGGRLLRCLAENASNVTPSCRAALAAAAGR
jgi:hypothetical protein